MDADKHKLCVAHRSCSRSSPCSLDSDKDAVYWDSVEAIRAAALGVRQKKTKGKTKTGKISGKGKTGTHEPFLLLMNLFFAD